MLIDLADYVLTYKVTSEEALTTARYCLLDAIGMKRIEEGEYERSEERKKE